MYVIIFGMHDFKLGEVVAIARAEGPVVDNACVVVGAEGEDVRFFYPSG